MSRWYLNKHVTRHRHLEVSARGSARTVPHTEIIAGQFELHQNNSYISSNEITNEDHVVALKRPVARRVFIKRQPCTSEYGKTRQVGSLLLPYDAPFAGFPQGEHKAL